MLANLQSKRVTNSNYINVNKIGGPGQDCCFIARKNGFLCTNSEIKGKIDNYDTSAQTCLILDGDGTHLFNEAQYWEMNQNGVKMHNMTENSSCWAQIEYQRGDYEINAYVFSGYMPQEYCDWQINAIKANTDYPSPSLSGGLSQGAVAGIVIGTLVLTGGVFFCCYKNWNRISNFVKTTFLSDRGAVRPKADVSQAYTSLSL